LMSVSNSTNRLKELCQILGEDSIALQTSWTKKEVVKEDLFPYRFRLLQLKSLSNRTL
jgi:hypothetical protein